MSGGCGILCTIRNCASFLPKIFENFEKIGATFADEYIIIIYYDISTDNTLDLLKAYALKNRKVIFFVNKETPLPVHRTHRIARGRNVVLEKFRSDFPYYNYFIVMDCDNVCAYNFKTGLLRECLHRKDWDMISFQHPQGYYDIYALSVFPYVMNCFLFRDANMAKKSLMAQFNRMRKDDLAYVLSAFNGFGIYRTKKFTNCYYDGNARIDYIPRTWLNANVRAAGPTIQPAGAEDCEHRFFHISAFLKNKARITVLPQCIFF